MKTYQVIVQAKYQWIEEVEARTKTEATIKIKNGEGTPVTSGGLVGKNHVISIKEKE